MTQEAPRVAFCLRDPSSSRETQITEEVDSEASDFKMPAGYKTPASSKGRKTTATEDRGAFLIQRRQGK